MVDVSVIIVNYNTAELTSQCVDSVYANTEGVSFEVIVVDNGSTVDDEEWLSADPRVRFVPAGANLGFGRANNLGIEQSTGQYVLFLNSDTVLLNNALLAFKEEYEKLPPDVGALGCLLVNGQGGASHSYAKIRVYSLTWDLFVVRPLRRLMRCTSGVVREHSRRDACFNVGQVIGADLFVSRQVLKQHGAFDPDFFLYLEETEMQARWARNGLRHYVTKAPRIMHLEGASAQNTLKDNPHSKGEHLLRFATSAKLFGRKTTSGPGWLFFRLTMLLFLRPALHPGRFSREQFKRLLRIVF